MKAVLCGITEEDLAERRAKGLDLYDEMWEGVLHMSPLAGSEHQGLIEVLLRVLWPYVHKHRLGELMGPRNVRDLAWGERDFRIPDLVFLAAGREDLVGKKYIEGGPDVAFEILSADDESYEKMPFYAKIGTRWLVFIEADGGRVEVYRRAGSEWVRRRSERGWQRCDPLKVSFRSTGRKRGLWARFDLEDRAERIVP